MEAASNSAAAPENKLPSWEEALRRSVIDGCGAPPQEAEEIVDLVRHAVDETRAQLLRIAKTCPSVWAQSMVLTNSASLIQGDMDRLIRVVHDYCAEQGRPFTVQPHRVSM